jgi:NADH-quinone oxidoreductase subunit J
MLFYLFAALILMGALGVILSPSPVASVMHMIVTLIGVSGTFFLLDAFFLGIIQIFVYAGAVMVLFLFVVMLLDIDKKSTLGGDWGTWLFSSLGSLALISLIAYTVDHEMIDSGMPLAQVNSGLDSNAQILNFTTSAKSFGMGLFTKYLLPLQISGFILLIAIIGVVLLGRKHTDTSA